MVRINDRLHSQLDSAAIFRLQRCDGIRSRGQGSFFECQKPISSDSQLSVAGIPNSQLGLLVLSNLSRDGCPERFPHRLDRDAIEYLLKEPGNDHQNRFLSRKPSRLSIEN